MGVGDYSRNENNLNRFCYNSWSFLICVYGCWNDKVYPNQKNHKSISDIISEIIAFWSWGNSTIVLLAGASCLCAQLNLNYGKNVTDHLSNSHSKCKKLSQTQFCNEVLMPSLKKEDWSKKKKKIEKCINKPTAIENALHCVPRLEVIQFEISSLRKKFGFF